MALLILDASVAIAYLDRRDVHHASAVAAMEASRLDDRALPASAYSEILVRAFKSGSAAVDEVDAFVADLAIQIQPIDAAIARRAAELRARHASLRLPDALVLATADRLDARVLTADRAWAKVSPRVRTI